MQVDPNSWLLIESNGNLTIFENEQDATLAASYADSVWTVQPAPRHLRKETTQTPKSTGWPPIPDVPYGKENT